MRIDSSGRLLVGASSTINGSIGNSANWPAIGQFNSTATSTISLGLFHWSTYAVDLGGAGGGLGNGPDIILARSNTNTQGVHVAVTNNILLGRVNFSGSDGTQFINGACIAAAVDGTPGANVMPGRLVFSTTADGAASPTERMRITSGGNILTNTTSTYSASLCTTDFNSTSQFGLTLRDTGSATDAVMMYFYKSGNVRGNITTTATATSFNTSSDYRLKQDVVPIENASSRVQQLRPVNFAWAETGSRCDGFLAHEAQAVVPQSVTGEKDAVDADGNPVYQGIDQSKLIPLLTAALQEAIGRIESLEAEVAILKAE
jgi:hypothetical protein